MIVKKIKLKNTNNKIKVMRVETVLVKKSNPLFNYFDDLSIKSLEFYNYANFTIRQIFFRVGDWIRYNELNKYLKNDKRYKNLPSQTSQQILKLLDKNWKSFFKSIKDFVKNKSKYLGKPRPPKYKNKNGRFIILFTNQQCKIKNNYLQFPKTKLKLKVRNIENIKMVRVIPLGGVYKVEIVYEKEIK
jgi:putative transposase